MSEIKLWRVHIRPTGPEGNVDVKKSVELCLRDNIIGIGWRVDRRPSSKEEYFKLGEKRHGSSSSWKSNSRAILYKMHEDDLVWIRDTNGIYYLGRICGDWEYRDNEENLQVDIINIRPVEKFYKVGTRVAGKIINSFIPSKTIQQIHDDTALLFSKIVYNKFNPCYYKIDKKENLDIFNLLSAEDLEDVVGLYLQLERGYVLIPSSRGRRDETIKYEYELLDKRGKRAFVQVKSGNVEIDPDDYDVSEGKYFLFSPAGYTRTRNDEGLETLSKDVINRFLKKNKDILPLNIKIWLDWLA